MGSPPRGRGKETVDITEWPTNRITPAWAGKSACAVICVVVVWDHPRVGGEKQRMPRRTDKQMGSPPRGRGKAMSVWSVSKFSRITPAWAGKSAGGVLVLGAGRDHPRVGGEKIFSAKPLPACLGSPPRGRGKGIERQCAEEYGRITPAWAGKRLKRSHRSGIFISGPIPFHSVLHRPAGSGGSRAGRDGSPAGQPQNAGPA